MAGLGAQPSNPEYWEFAVLKVAVVYNRESRNVINLFGTPNRETIGLETLRRIADALVLCRESTIRHGLQALQGNYQVVYRSVEAYRDILVDAGFDVVSFQANTAYINVQIACELIKKWKALVGTNPTGGDRFQCLPVVGRLVYWWFRLGYAWNTRLIPWLFARMGREFPMLTNHFFVLRPSLQAPADRRDRSLHGARIEEEMFENARGTHR